MGDKKSLKRNSQVISYLTLRRSVGILGIALPIILIIGSVCCGDCKEIQRSISAYYHTNMRDLFVGILCAIALFLFAYKGYDHKDAAAGNLAGLFALGVALFPTSITKSLTHCIPFPVDNGIISIIHYASATGLFLVLAYFSIFLFTKSNKKKPSEMKKWRNILYYSCGGLILICIILIGVYSICDSRSKCRSLYSVDPVFWLEAMALWAFGISWLIKGRTIMLDEKD